MKSALIICRAEAVIESLKIALGEDYLVRLSAGINDAAELVYRDQADLLVIEGEPETQSRLDEIGALSAINPAIPTVVIATSANSPFARRAYEAGAAEVIGKPFDREDLRRSLAKAARLRELALKAAQVTPARSFPTPQAADENRSITAQLLLRSLQGLIAAGANSKELSEALAESVSELLAPSSIAVFLLNRSLSHFVCRAAERCPAEIERQPLNRSDPLVRWLASHRRILSDELIAAEGPTDDAPAVQRSASALGGKVVVPLLGSKRLIGFVALGSKLTSSTYSPGDMELLTRLSFASSPPLEKALELESRLPEGARAEAISEGLEPTPVAAEPELRRFWSNLSARLAHEIKNPLVAIKTFTQLLPERYGEEAFRNQFFKVVSGEVDRLNTITEQLVRFAQPPELSLTPVDLEPVTRLALSELEEEIRLSNAEVVVDVPAVLPKVMADSSAIREALTYIIDNGLDAVAENNSSSIRISASALSSNNATTIRLTVEDSGIGIVKEQLRDVFVPFFTTKIRGIGLGLSIAKRIIEDHRGNISVESEEGRGTRVHITLPAAG